MTEQYVKQSRDYFPDFCDQVIRGISTLGDKFEVKTPNIVNNPMIWTNQLIGVKNPYWKEQVKRHQDASTFMTAQKVSVKARRCVISVITKDVSGYAGNYREFRWDGYPHYGGVPSLSGPSAAVLSAARNLALRKFFNRVNEARTSVEGGQLLGEWKETVQAITNPLGALRQFTVRHVVNAKKRLRRIQNSHGGRRRRRPGDSSGVKSRNRALADALAGTYLEFVFGWIPLANDVRAAVNGLLDRYNQPDYRTITAKGEVGYNESPQDVQLFNDNFVEAVQSRVNISTVNVRFKACIATGAVNGVRSVSQTLGFLPERFVPTIWELIPYSFVVDYFVNIGDIINAYSFQKMVLQFGQRTTRIKTGFYAGDVYTRFASFPIPDYYPKVRQLIRMGATGGGAEVFASSVERLPIDRDSFMPDLSIHLPISNKPWLNLGALLTQKFCSL